MVIEFNGTYFHMDNRFYNSSDILFTGATYNDVKKHDYEKITAYLVKKYNIIEVWEYDFLNHKMNCF